MSYWEFLGAVLIFWISGFLIGLNVGRRKK